MPRTVSKRTTEYRQVLVSKKEEALARFKQANYLDCRILAYVRDADENASPIARFRGKRRAVPTTIIVMIDLDSCNFKTRGPETSHIY
ncbi:MAG: hypothetical protein ACR2IS_15525 [Nitrososphaeraceae archaeon]